MAVLASHSPGLTCDLLARTRQSRLKKSRWPCAMSLGKSTQKMGLSRHVAHPDGLYPGRSSAFAVDESAGGEGTPASRAPRPWPVRVSVLQPSRIPLQRANVSSPNSQPTRGALRRPCGSSRKLLATRDILPPAERPETPFSLPSTPLAKPCSPSEWS
jgi:hypothetical protein